MLTRAAQTSDLDPDALFASLRAARGLVLAVSGGPDSTALLLLIADWRARADVPVTVATVDHRLRPESASEIKAVSDLCARLGVPHRTLVWDAPAKTRVQERARDARYALLAALAREVGADTIVTAHHADDQAETILMRLLRGSGPAGLAGMAARREHEGLVLARPLLDVPKAALVAFCHGQGVAFAEDPANTKGDARRAQIRRLMPLLAEEGLDNEALLRLGRRAARLDEVCNLMFPSADIALHVSKSANSITISVISYRSWPAEIRLRVLGAEIHRLSGSRPRLERLESLESRLAIALAGDGSFSATLAGCMIRLARGQLTISRAPPRSDRNSRQLSSGRILGKATPGP